MAIVRLANDHFFDAAEGTSLLVSAEVAGLTLEHSCRTGRCSSCKARVSSGATVALRAEEGLTAQESADGWILTCVRGPASDLVLSIADLGDVPRPPRRVVPCRIQSLEPLADDVLRVVLRTPPTSPLRLLPGQFIDVIGAGGMRRSYSVANADPAAAGGIELHVRQVAGGAMSAYWFGPAATNDLLRLDGPLGTFFVRAAPGEDVVFLATGTGIAPVKAMLEGLAALPAGQRPANVAVYWGGRTARDHYWKPPESLAALRMRFVLVCSRPDDGWAGARGHVQDVYLADRPDLARAWVYACGSSAMVDAAEASLSAAGLPADRFHSDAFVPSN